MNNTYLKEITIYTDGACSGNPGPGAWAAILIYNGIEKELVGYESNTTNNRMELTAAIEAISAVKYSCSIKLFSDSSYLINAINNNWLGKWKNNDWHKSNKQPAQNIDLWEKISSLIQIHDIKWIKVKGHSDNSYNNRCDKLATSEISKHKK